jgi:hypothetical protein
MTDEEIEKQVREINKDLPEGLYDCGDFMGNKEMAILFEIELRKQVRDYLSKDI